MPLPTIPLTPMPAASSSVSSRFTAHSQRDVPVLALRNFLALVAQHLQGAAELRARLLGEDHLVDVAQLGRLVRVGEGVAIFFHQLLARGALFQLAAED